MENIPYLKESREVLMEGARNVISTACPQDVSNIKADADTVCHKHPQREICFILHGAGKFVLNGMSYDAEPGTAFLIDSFENHSLGYKKTDKSLLQLWFHFNNDYIISTLTYPFDETPKGRVYKFFTFANE